MSNIQIGDVVRFRIGSTSSAYYDNYLKSYPQPEGLDTELTGTYEGVEQNSELQLIKVEGLDRPVRVVRFERIVLVSKAVPREKDYSID